MGHHHGTWDLLGLIGPQAPQGICARALHRQRLSISKVRFVQSASTLGNRSGVEDLLNWIPDLWRRVLSAQSLRFSDGSDDPLFQARGKRRASANRVALY